MLNQNLYQRNFSHQIPLKIGSKPVSIRPYRFSYFRLRFKKIVEELLKNAFIQPSTSSYSSPVLLVKKKDGTWGLCIDYRKLNEGGYHQKQVSYSYYR